MRHFRFQGLLQQDGWLEPAYVAVDAQGKITRLSNAPEDNSGEVAEVDGYAIPGFHNAHSHAFQYAMAGLAEFLRAPSDDFWSWREAMYHLALTLQPEQVEDIAAMLYAEMVRHGYTAVAEFHYLHHDPHGNAYANQAEIGMRLMRAAQTAGIRLTLIPIYYNTGDFGKHPSPQQRRFISADVDRYLRLVEASEQAAKGLAHVSVGLGIHSLRAASAQDVQTLFAARKPGQPMHIHIAEQQKEVDACLAHLGQRPVAWLADHVKLDADCHLVHATHLVPDEVARLAHSKAVAVICPSTEGNLGDGFFDLHPFLAADGNLAIGSDSHICLSPLEELRWLDYGCRMNRQKRNVVCREEGQDSAALLFAKTLAGGRRSTGLFQESYFEVGASFDAAIIDASFPLIAHTNPERRLATYLYAGDASALLGTIIAGKWQVREGKHICGAQIKARFQAVTLHTRSR